MLTHLRDWKWINAFIAAMKKSEEDRTMLVEAAIYLIQGQRDILASLEHIKSLVQDLPNLVLEIKGRLKPTSTSLDMFAIMVDRLDDLKVLLLSDASPR
jgi:hypothetical protein